MAEPEAFANPDDLARQVRQVLDSLRMAGVGYVPDAARPAGIPPPAPVRPAMTARQPLPTVSIAPATQVSLSSAPSAPSAPKSDNPGPDSIEGRLAELQALAARVAECQRCPALASTRTQTVFGVGPLDPELCFIGEAPGADEDAQGEPFVGAAGQLLNRIIAACGMKREDVFICNILRCRPPNNRQPNAEEAGHCREYLERTLELVRPKFICCLGATAAQNLLETTQTIGRMRGRVLEYNGIPVVCTYHPSYILRTPAPQQPERKRAVWDDMKKLLARMGRTVPGQG